MAKIRLTRGEIAYIDNEDLELTKICMSWWAVRRGDKVYVQGWNGKAHVFLHWVVTKRKYVYHIDGNGLNNRKSNLKHSSRSPKFKG